MQLKNATTKRWIAVDGGGTKTICVIGDEQGHILSKAIGVASNIHTISHQKVYKTLTDIMERVIVDSGSILEQIESIYLCLAGADRDNDKWIIKNLFKNTVYEQKIKIKNDAQAALASGTWGESGLILIAGTGSIVYGISTTTGKSTRVGGWGFLLGDEGSGFYIGQRALKAVMKSYDDRGPKTELTTLILNHFQLQHVPELVRIYSGENIVPNIAKLSKIVFSAAKNEDPVALEILENAVNELIKMVEAASQKQFESKEDVLVLHGGLFSDSLFKNLFLGKLKSIHQNFKIVQPEIPAVIGAYLLGIRESGIIIDEKIKKNIRLSWDETNFLE
ncbi:MULTISPECIES: BadF/BadG/BcrA/BcrD ATPase family protein [Mesobacillus]|uniref:ATPase BadF/BadG/BcrA/BcrD type domain-containing protein n=2 Tax=Mesobacillus TaxID=2675231 RepID=A0A0D6ZGT6_9BACI|nr:MULTISPECIES: BadF/BadG/BcrA/BcrD ATPase family protein [Mesobacillus]KIY23858.1 hypothetical protein UB32_00560 [Mesobacillus subterraneus]MDQ0415481.1 N-acetylglucosamine kinase-like BadF-type ATPase [Mesobacillus stamsii]